MKFRKTRRCSITANNLLRFSVGIALVFSALSVAADCQSGKGITSNDVIAVTGEADTLWTLVWEGPRNQFAVNSIIHGGDSVSLNKDNNWLSYTLGCISSDIHDLAYGDGRLVLCFDTLKFGQPNPVLLLTRNGNSINKQDFSLGWPVDSSSLDLTAREVVWVNNAFYFACMDAGLVRWDYKNQTKSVFSGKIFQCTCK